MINNSKNDPKTLLERLYGAGDLRQLPELTCACSECQSACDRMPGWFLPEQIEPAANAAGLTEQEFFKTHCTVDYWAGDVVFVIRPRRVDESGGGVAAYIPLGRCANFIDGACSIYSTRPFECSRVKHDLVPKNIHQRIADAWRTDEAQAMVVRLYGGQPRVPDPDYRLLDMIPTLW